MPATDALRRVADWLTCPTCGGGLGLLPEGSLGCASGHRYDVARQGYVNLLGANHQRVVDVVNIAGRDLLVDEGHDIGELGVYNNNTDNQRQRLAVKCMTRFGPGDIVSEYSDM